MKRKIITIDENLCTGCGECISSCSEGALKLINGKARLVREDFCDGFGDCIGDCPTGALKIEEKDVPAFNEVAVKENLMKHQGISAVKKMEEAQKRHQPADIHHHNGQACPGSMHRSLKKSETPAVSSVSGSLQAIPSDLAQWPVQLHLVSPKAEFFKNKELVVLSTCAPIASADIHWRFLRGRSVVVACPKLDNTSPYVNKLADIFRETTIPKIHVVIMEVPCCKGLSHFVQEARVKSGRNDLIIEETVVNLNGYILQSKIL